MLPLSAASLPEDAVELGRIGEAWGIQGWFKVVPFSGEADAIFHSSQWLLQAPERGARHFSGTVAIDIKHLRWHGEQLVAFSESITERTQSEQLRGARIFISRSDFPPVEKDEYYWVDLIGLEVRNRQDEILGRVTNLLPTGAQTVLVLTEDRMIPFVDAYIDKVDLQNKIIIADWQLDY